MNNYFTIQTKIPLWKMRMSEKTEQRMMDRYSTHLCFIFSRKHGGFKKGEGWVQDMFEEDPDIFTVEEAYKLYKGEMRDVIDFYVIKYK